MDLILILNLKIITLTIYFEIFTFSNSAWRIYLMPRFGSSWTRHGNLLADAKEFDRAAKSFAMAIEKAGADKFALSATLVVV